MRGSARGRPAGRAGGGAASDAVLAESRGSSPASFRARARRGRARRPGGARRAARVCRARFRLRARVGWTRSWGGSTPPRPTRRRRSRARCCRATSRSPTGPRSRSAGSRWRAAIGGGARARAAAWERIGVIEYSQAGYAVADAQLAAGDPEGARATLETFGWVQPALWTLDRLKTSRSRCGCCSRWTASTRRRPGPARAGRVRRAADRRLRCRRRPRRGRGAAGAGRRRGSAAVARAGAAAGDQGDAPCGPADAGPRRGGAGGRRSPDDAREELRRAAADLDARGAWGYRDPALRALRRLGDRPRVASAGGDGGGDGDPSRRERARA